MSKSANEWQVFSVPFRIPEGVTHVEFRGMGFLIGITDIYMDYINIVPDNNKGLLSDDFTIDGKGNVGIHTAAPKEALSVNGNILSRKVKVETANWPDYVFKPTDPSPPITAVRAYISKYQHLQDIPSEADVVKESVNLCEIANFKRRRSKN